MRRFSYDVRLPENQRLFGRAQPLSPSLGVEQSLQVVAEYRRPMPRSNWGVIGRIDRFDLGQPFGMPEEIIHEIIIEVKQGVFRPVLAFRTRVVNPVSANLNEKMRAVEFVKFKWFVTVTLIR